jgi:putative peptidoglycan lipid II flippase
VTTTQALARAGIVVSGAFLVARVLGWVRLVVIGNTFGASSDLDAFFAAFRVPDLIFQLVAAGALSSALIPVISGLLTTDTERRAWRVVSTVTNLMLMALLVLTVIAFIGAPAIVAVVASGFDAVTTDKTIALTRTMLLSPIFLALGAVATSVLNARDRFGAAAMAPIAYNLAIIAGAIFLAPIMGVEGLAVGVVAGSIAHLLVQLSPLRSLGFRYRPVIDAGDPAARRALALMAPRAIGLGATQITFVVVTSLASNLGVGAVTSLTVAFTLLQIPIGVIGVPLGVVLFPSMSREVATGNIREFVHLLTRAMRLLAFVMLPSAVLIALLRVEGIALLFRSFDPTAIEMTAAALLAFLVGLVAHSLIAVLARSFYAQQDTLTPVLAAVGAVIVNTTLAVVLVGPLGLPGIALAIAIAAWLEAGALALILHRRVRTLSYRGVWVVAARSVVATALAGLVGFAVRLAVGGALVPDPTSTEASGIVPLTVTIVVTSVAFGLAFIVAALMLRIHELRSIVEIMVHAIRRPERA